MRLSRIGTSVRAALLVTAALLASGCYRGAARPTTSASLSADRGWVALAGVPQVLQGGEHDCGPAAAAMLLGYWGLPTGQDAVRAASAVPPDQSLSAGFLRSYLRSRGLKAFLIEGTLLDLERELSAGRPVLVGILKPYTSGSYAHYLVVIGFNRAAEEIAVIDPAGGLRDYSFAGFNQEWSGARSLTLVATLPGR